MGVIFLSILVPYFFVFAFVGAALRKRTATVTDQRLSLMNQVVSAPSKGTRGRISFEKR